MASGEGLNIRQFSKCTKFSMGYLNTHLPGGVISMARSPHCPNDYYGSSKMGAITVVM